MAIVPAEQFPFCSAGYNQQVSPVLDSRASINLYCEPQMPGAKTGVGLVGRPGLLSWGFPLANTPVRALWPGDNRMFAVGGTHFYELNNFGNVLTDFGAMAGSGGKGPAQVIANGTQLLVCDPSAAQIYYANPVGPAMNSVFNGSALEYLDGFYVAIAFGASLAGANPNQINVSANGDGTTWPGLGYAIRTSSADLTTQLTVLNNFLWIFGQKTISIWYNAGTPTFPFAQMNGGQINVGLLSPASVVKFYNTVMWLGSDGTGATQVYMAQGFSPVKVSTAAIEYILSIKDQRYMPLCWAFGYQEAGHTFYVLNIVDQNSVPYDCYVYDLTTGLWHRRAYLGPWPVSFAQVPGFTTNLNGQNIVGDGKSGQTYYQNIQYASDGAAIIQYSRTAPHLPGGQNESHTYNRFELDGEFGDANPEVGYSNNGGRSYVPWSYPMRQAADQSYANGFRRFYALQLGQSRDRVFQVSIVSSTALIRIANAYLDVD